MSHIFSSILLVAYSDMATAKGNVAVNNSAFLAPGVYNIL